MQDCEWICGGAQADIPDDEVALVGCESGAQAGLADVKRFGLRDGADDRVKSFAVRDRMDAMNAGSDPNEFVTGSAQGQETIGSWAICSGRKAIMLRGGMVNGAEKG